jgi:membrane protease YdiL (CAAX protease family)
MGIYIEALILYVVLFFSGSTGLFTYRGEGFSITAEIVRTVTYTIPSLALIWYLLLRARRIRDWNIALSIKDLISCLIALPCLILTGFFIASVSYIIGGSSAQMSINFPSTTPGWVVLCFSCLFSAYLEESFFRFYLLARRDELKLNALSALVVSVALFSICHIYEGPWGFLNSAISGMILCFVFLRYHSLHGIAMAHSLYNIFIYVDYAVIAQNPV